MIKFGDKNIAGVFNGDTPITSAYSGSELVFKAGGKYPENSYVFEVVTTSANQAVPFPIKGTTTNVSIDWGDGKVVPNYSWSATNAAHIFANPGKYISVITVKDAKSGLNIENNPNQGTYEEFKYVRNILHTPKGTTYKLTGDSSKDYSYVNLGLLEDPNIVGTPVIKVKSSATDDTNKELTIGNFPMDGGTIDVYGLYTKVLCKSSFKPSNPSGSRFYIWTISGSKVTEIDGLDARGIKQSKPIIVPWNEIIQKISNLRIGEFTDSNIKIFNISSTHTVPDLVYVDIKNLGEFATNGLTYDFTGLDAWGDEAKAAELGVTGARQSLIDTLVNNSFNVNGKNVTLNLPLSVKNRLTEPAIKTIEAKGYILPKYDPNATVFEVTINKIPDYPYIKLPLTSYGNCTIDWGDGTVGTRNISNTDIYYAPEHKITKTGKYNIVVTPDHELTDTSYITGGNANLSYYTKIILVSNTYKASYISLSLYDDYGQYGKDLPSINEITPLKVNVNSVNITTVSQDPTQTELVVHPQNAKDAYSLTVSGLFETVRFSPDFKLNPNSYLSLSSYNYSKDKVEPSLIRILGHMNLREGKLYGGGNLIQNNDPKFNMIEEVTLPLNYNTYTYMYFGTEIKSDLVYLKINNVGENVPNNFIYKCDKIPHWGDETMALSLGITGALKSLNDTMLNAYDVNGKNVKIEMSDEIFNRLSPEAVLSLKDKGYMLNLFRAIELEYTLTDRLVAVLPITMTSGSYTVDWGDGTKNREYNHLYSNSGTYKVRFTPEESAEYNFEFNLTRDNKHLTNILSYGIKPFKYYLNRFEDYTNCSPSLNLIGNSLLNLAICKIYYNEGYTKSKTFTLNTLEGGIGQFFLYGFDTLLIGPKFKSPTYWKYYDNDKQSPVISLNDVTLVLGHFDLSNSQSRINKSYVFGYSIANLLKIEHLSLFNDILSNLTVKLDLNLSNPKLSYLYIDNLGYSDGINTIYDFFDIPNWGDDTMLEGSLDSLIRTIESALDVTGKNISLNIDDKVFNRIPVKYQQMLKDKGYILDLFNRIKLRYVTTLPNEWITLPIWNNQNVNTNEFKIDWGNGDIVYLKLNTVNRKPYAKPGEYIVEISKIPSTINLSKFYISFDYNYDFESLKEFIALPKISFNLSDKCPYLTEFGGPAFDQVYELSITGNGKIYSESSIFTLKEFKGLQKLSTIKIKGLAKEINLDKFTYPSTVEYSSSIIFDFRECQSLEKITGVWKIPKFNGVLGYLNGTTKYVERVIYPKDTYTQSMIYGFLQGTNLANCTIEGIGLISNVTTYNFYQMSAWGNDSIYPGSKLSLIDSLITYSASVSGVTINLAAETYNRLTSDEIAQIQAKGYTLTHA